MKDDVTADEDTLCKLLWAARDLAMYGPARDTEIGTAGEALARRIVLQRTHDSCIYVHEWYRSDPDDLHDHPADSVSLVLTGGYFETTEAGRFWRPPGSVVFRKAEDRHRIELVPDVLATSLFIMGVNRREWGFHTTTGFVVGREYRALPPDVKAEISASDLLHQP